MLCCLNVCVCLCACIDVFKGNVSCTSLGCLKSRVSVDLVRVEPWPALWQGVSMISNVYHGHIVLAMFIICGASFSCNLGLNTN